MDVPKWEMSYGWRAASAGIEGGFLRHSRLLESFKRRYFLVRKRPRLSVIDGENIGENIIASRLEVGGCVSER
jgi:hypothetical protein